MLIHGLSYAASSDGVSIKALTQQFANGDASCEQVIKSYLQRIKKYDLSHVSKAPYNAISAINTQALSQAKALDLYLKQHKQLKGVLHCVPVVIKDNFDSIDTPTTNGSLSLLGSQPIADAALVQRLKKQGAIVIAKAGMDEFASGLIGVSSSLGRIGNAYDTSKNPGGSSGGSAVAVANQFALVGLGSDNSGSVRVPAAFNGLFGLRPSYDLLDPQGLFPRGILDAVAGPMTKNIEDLNLIMQVLSTAYQKQRKQLDAGVDPRRITIATVKQFNDKRFNYHTYRRFIEQLKALGFKIVEVNISRYDANRTDNTAGDVELINQYLRRFPSTRKNFRDICESGRTQTFGSKQQCLDYIKTNPKLNSKAYKAVQKRIKKNQQLIHALMHKKNIHALLLPITKSGASTYNLFDIYTWRYPLSSNAGLPGLAVPIGLNKKNLPIGIELIGKFGSDALLIAIAKCWYDKYARLKPPQLLVPERDLSAMEDNQWNQLKHWIGWQTYKHFLAHNPAQKLSPGDFTMIINRVLKQTPWQQH